jgi:hypothetical protein
MPYVSEKLIEITYKRMGVFEGTGIQKLQKRHQKSQKALTMFVYSFLRDFDEDACGVLLYIFHVVVEAFCNANPRPKRVSKPQIETAIEEKEAQAYSSMAMTIEHSPEPFALNYVFEALTDEQDLALTKDTIASFFAILVIVTECLHRACSRS